jgi:chromate transporter
VTGPTDGAEAGATPTPAVPLTTIVREWGRIGVVGFGGPPTHIALLRALCVTDRRWLTATEFEDGIAVTNLLPGPASTQLAIFCAWRLGGTAGALAGGLSFILPGLVIILALSAVFFGAHPPLWVLGAAAGAGAAVPAVAVHAATGLLPGSWQRVGAARPARIRWILYVVAGGTAAATVGPWLVLVLVGCGALEVIVRRRPTTPSGRSHALAPLAFPAVVAVGGFAAIAWVALKVGALSYGGGFVIVPLMQHDAVHTYHWMTAAQFLDAVALGQLTPGPVVQTVAAVGYAAAGIGGGMLAAAVAFAPSFVFVLAGGRHFDRIRANLSVRSFLIGAGPAALGAIAGSAIPLGLALSFLWQGGVLVLAAGWMFGLRRSVVAALVGAGSLGVVAALAGAPVPH